MRLIDADAIKLPEGFFEKVDNVPKFYDWLNSLPTIDAVPVVRCKDCKYSEHWRRDERMCSLWNDAWVFDDGFCNHAKRRTDETN